MNTCVVIPTCRTINVENFKYINVPILVVNDTGRTLQISDPKFKILNYDDYPECDGIVWERTAACRNLGFYVAWKEGYDIIISTDDDVEYPENYVQSYVDVLTGQRKITQEGVGAGKWYNPFRSNQWFMRGFPYELRANYWQRSYETNATHNIVCHMGLVNGVLDMNGIDKLSSTGDELVRTDLPTECPPGEVLVHQHFPLSAMSVAVKRDALVALYQVPTDGKVYGDFPIHRIEDIWAGYVLQRLSQIRGYGVSFGDPVAIHKKQGNLKWEMVSEHYPHLMGKYFYRWVDRSGEIVPESYPVMYKKLATNMLDTVHETPRFCRRTFRVIAEMMCRWADLFIGEAHP